MAKSTYFYLMIVILNVSFTCISSNIDISILSASNTTRRVQRSLLLDFIWDQTITRPINNIGKKAVISAFDILRNSVALISELPIKVINTVMQLFATGTKNEDINLNIMQLIQKYGFKAEKHEVRTNDGYILTMYRIQRSGPPVLLMHGLLSSADDWITAGPESGIGYLLASEDYDVWLGNARGNKHSRSHVTLAPTSKEFWDFSWEEIGRYDLPAMIDYILKVTNRPKLQYVGHSQGTTSFFVMCSERPEYNEKISLMIALSAVAWMSHIKSPIIRFISPLNPLLHTVLEQFGLHEFLPDSALVQSFKTKLCGKEQLAEIFCNNILFIICGFDYDQVNVTNLPVLFAHLPSGAATKQLIHYGQGIVSGEFQKFDYGKGKNKVLYGSPQPPAYPVERITAPIAIFYSNEDWLANVTDIHILRRKLKNVVDFYEIPHKKFNHLDFIWAKDVKTLVFVRLLQLLKAHN